MAQGRDGNAVHACGVEYRGTWRDCDLLAVDREFDERAQICLEAAVAAGAVGRGCAIVKQTLEGHSRRTMCASNSSRKCFITDAIGAGTTCPSPQIEVSRSASDSSSINAISNEDPCPCVQPVSKSTNFCEPTRHGTHFPHDSFRKNELSLVPALTKAQGRVILNR